MTDKAIKKELENTIKVYGTLCDLVVCNNTIKNVNKFTGTKHPFSSGNEELKVTSIQLKKLIKDFSLKIVEY